MKTNHSESCPTTQAGFELTRRDFLKYSAWTAFATVAFPSLTFSADNLLEIGYPISSDVKTTLDRMLSFSMSSNAFTVTDLPKVSEYQNYGYGYWTYGVPLPMKKRLDLMPRSLSKNSTLE